MALTLYEKTMLFLSFDLIPFPFSYQRRGMQSERSEYHP